MGFFGAVGQKLSAAFGGGKPTPPGKPNGSDGVSAYGGYLSSQERSPELTGSRKWITFENATNKSIIATGLRYSLGLISGTTWHAEPNEAGGADAERGAQIVTEGLLNAQMPRPWSTVVRKMALYKYLGFSIHEWTTAVRSDGMIVYADIAHRPQYTIDRWDKPDERMPWQAVSQLTRSGKRYVIPRVRCAYCVDDTLTDSPSGRGLLRHVAELVRQLDVLEGLEILAYQTDLRGMPIGRAPIGELMLEARNEVGADRTKMNAFVAERTKTLRDQLTSHAKTPEQLMYLLFDSGTFRGQDGNTITGTQKWAFELLRGDGNGVAEVAAAIGRKQLEIARVLGVEFAMMGGDSSGSLAQHSDKTGIFGTIVQTTSAEIAAFCTNDLARPLVAMNGLDPETCTPKLVVAPISTDDVEMVCRSLQLLQSAGLAPDDPVWDVIRERLRLPPRPEVDMDLMGVLGMRPPQDPKAGPPDPNAGEEDVNVEDLGAESNKRAA